MSLGLMAEKSRSTPSTSTSGEFEPLIDRTAADLVGESAAGREIGLRDFQTGDFAFQAFADGRNRNVLQCLTVEFGDRGGYRPPRLLAVADHYDLIYGD